MEKSKKKQYQFVANINKYLFEQDNLKHQKDGLGHIK